MTVPASNVTVVNAETAPHQDSALSDSAQGDAAAVPRARTPADAIEDADVEATLAEHRRWVAAGRPGAVSHAEAMAELLRDGQ
jgi:hypothetical protein